MHRAPLLCLLLLRTAALSQTVADGKDLPSAQPKDLIHTFVDDDQRIVLRGNQHPLARSEFDRGSVSPNYPDGSDDPDSKPGRGTATHSGRTGAGAADPGSPHYHQWLTPEEYGISENDLEQVLNYNSVPGVTGFTAGTGYDRATGLGSVDASVLVSHWSDATVTPAFHASLASGQIAVTAGSNASTNLSVTVSGGFNSAVSFSATGLPTGVSATFTPTSLPAPGSGTSVFKLAASSSAKPGTYTASVSTTSGSTVQKAAFSITVAPAPTFALGAAQNSVSVPAGSSRTVTLSTTGNSMFNSAISFSVSGLPAGMTATFAPATIAATGSGSTVVTFNASSPFTPKSYLVVVAAAGGGVTQTTNVTVNVPGFTLAASTATVSVSGGTTKGLATLTATALGGFASAITLSVSGVPNGIAASFSPQSLAAPGSGRSTLTLTKGTGASVGSAKLTVTASGGGIQQTTAITLNVTK